MFGGYPPNCDDITAEKDKLCTFIDHLFVHQEQLDEDVKYVLTASILRFYQEYCIFVSNEPDGKFKIFAITGLFLLLKMLEGWLKLMGALLLNGRMK